MEFMKGKPRKSFKANTNDDYDFVLTDYDSFENEINEFYSALDTWDCGGIKNLYQDSPEEDFDQILYWNLGIQGNFTNGTSHVTHIFQSSIEILKMPNIYLILLENLELKSALSLLYNIILVLERSPEIEKDELEDLSVKFIVKLFDLIHIDSACDLQLILSKRLLTLYKLLRILTGGKDGLQKLKDEKRLR